MVGTITVHKSIDENYSKDGSNILIQQQQMAGNEAEWNILIVFCGYNLVGKVFGELQIMNLDIFEVPMIVGSNERLFAWMDEGFAILFK
jgi:hypothetical protein